MPDDGGPRGFRNVALAQPIIIFPRGTRPRRLLPLFWPLYSVTRIYRIAPDFSKGPQIHQRHSLTFRDGQRLVLPCSVCVFSNSAKRDSVHVTERLHLRRDTVESRLRRPYTYIEHDVFGLIPHHYFWRTVCMLVLVHRSNTDSGIQALLSREQKLSSF